jgi:hypothetical protein
MRGGGSYSVAPWQSSVPSPLTTSTPWRQRPSQRGPWVSLASRGRLCRIRRKQSFLNNPREFRVRTVTLGTEQARRWACSVPSVTKYVSIKEPLLSEAQLCKNLIHPQTSTQHIFFRKVGTESSVQNLEETRAN